MLIHILIALWVVPPMGYILLNFDTVQEAANAAAAPNDPSFGWLTAFYFFIILVWPLAMFIVFLGWLSDTKNKK